MATQEKADQITIATGGKNMTTGGENGKMVWVNLLSSRVFYHKKLQLPGAKGNVFKAVFRGYD